MRGWLDGGIDPVLTGGLLAALRAKGTSGEELAAMAAVLRQACPLPGERPALELIDTCGTGGAGADSFNISTAVAFTAAACGAHVAKHGNRSASGRVGSADVLEALGLDLAAPLATVVEALPRTGVTFLFAPGWHPALVGMAPLRRTLGVRTVFNLLGPLVNPLTPEAQVLGVARPDLLDPMAEALRRLGQRRAVVVHGHGGLDEATLSGPSELRLLEDGEVRRDWLDPAALGLAPADLEALRGGDVAANRAILEAVLRAAAPGPRPMWWPSTPPWCCGPPGWSRPSPPAWSGPARPWSTAAPGPGWRPCAAPWRGLKDDRDSCRRPPGHPTGGPRDPQSRRRHASRARSRRWHRSAGAGLRRPRQRLR